MFGINQNENNALHQQRRRRRIAKKRRSSKQEKVTSAGGFPVNFSANGTPSYTGAVPLSSPSPSPAYNLYTQNMHPSSRTLLNGSIGPHTANPETSSPAIANKRVLSEVPVLHPKRTEIVPSTDTSESVRSDALAAKVESVETFVQNNSLKVNVLEEKRSHMHIRCTTMQTVQDQLQKECQALKEKITLLEEALVEHRQEQSTVPVWFYANCTVEKQQLYTAAELTETAEEWVEIGEQVLLMHPITVDKQKNVWVKARRLFKNGSVQDYFVPFYTPGTQKPTFDDFTFSSVSCI